MKEYFDRRLKDFRPAQADDIVPLKGHVGVGPKGDSFRIEVVDDEKSEARTILEGYEFDEEAKEWNKIWESENINGGKLECYETVHFNDNPKTFQLMFSYIRPGRKHWSMITPAIPFMYDHPRRGTDVAVSYIKNHKYEEGTTDLKWIDVLSYPEGPERQEFNPPNPPGGRDAVSETKPSELGEPWSIALDVPQFIEMADLMGWTYNDLIKALNGNTEALVGKLYPDIKEGNILDFTEALVNFIEVKFDKEIEKIKERLDTLETKVEKLEQITSALDGALADLASRIYNTTYNAESHSFHFNPSGMIPFGTINVYGWPGDNKNNGGSILVHHEAQNKSGDIKAT